jgi:hypothetical protein
VAHLGIGYNEKLAASGPTERAVNSWRGFPALGRFLPVVDILPAAVEYMAQLGRLQNKVSMKPAAGHRPV